MRNVIARRWSAMTRVEIGPGSIDVASTLAGVVPPRAASMATSSGANTSVS